MNVLQISITGSGLTTKPVGVKNTCLRLVWYTELVARACTSDIDAARACCLSSFNLALCKSNSAFLAYIHKYSRKLGKGSNLKHICTKTNKQTKHMHTYFNTHTLFPISFLYLHGLQLSTDIL